MNALLLAATIGLVSLVGQPTPDLEAQIDLKRRESYDALVAAVKVHDAALARELKLQQQGASSEMEVNARRQAIAVLRHDLAVTNDHPDEVRDQTRAIVEFREANLKRLTKLRGVGAVPLDLVDAARRQVANAKYKLAVEEGDTEDAVRQLQAIVEICQGELKRVEASAKAGSSSSAEVGMIRGRLALANYLLESESDNPGKATAHLRAVLAEREAGAARIEKLYRVGAAGRIVFVEAQHHCLWAKANLAIEENDRGKTRDILKKLAELTKDNLDHLKTHPDVGTPELIARNKAILADCELRLLLAADNDTPLVSLLRKPIHELDY